MKIKRGDSISVNGICSTAAKAAAGTFEVFYMPETIRRTTVGSFRRGSLVNLELPLTLSSLLDGHLVQGHIDYAGKILEVKKEGASRTLKISLPPRYRKLVVEKGSVAVDGASLTVAGKGPNWFSVSLIEYTLENTTLGTLVRSDPVNVETDILGKYAASLLKK